jgi:hypothetical protein
MGCAPLRLLNILIKNNFYHDKILMISRLSGKKFWNLFHLQPMRDQKVTEILLNQILYSISIELGC